MKYWLALLFLLFAVSAEAATTYWASPSGGAGTCAAASGTSDPGTYRTFAQGLACMAAGDTLMLKDGTYTTAWDINGKNGTASAYYTIRAATIGTGITRTRGVVLKVTAVLPMMQVQNSSYVEIRGIKFDASLMGTGGLPTDSGAAIYLLDNDNHIRFADNEIVDSSRAGLTMSRSDNGFVEGNHEIQNNWIHNIGLGSNPAMTHGIYVKLSTTLVEGNRIEDVAGWGIHAYNNGAVTSDSIFRYNLIKNAGTSAQARGGGILDFDSTGTLIYGNIFINIPTWALDIEQSANNVKVINNTFYNNAVAIYLGPIAGTQIINNILSTNTTQFSNNGSTGTTTTNNLCSPAACGFGTSNQNDASAAVTFNNAAGEDFSLKTGSTALSTGADVHTNLNCVSASTCLDYAGHVRPQGAGWDIGAYEFISGSLPVVTITGPTSSPTYSTSLSTITLSGTSSLP